MSPIQLTTRQEHQLTVIGLPHLYLYVPLYLFIFYFSCSSSQATEDITNVQRYYVPVTSPNGETEYIPCNRDKGYKYKPDAFTHPQSALAHKQIGFHVCGLEIGAASYAPFGLNTVDVGLTEDLAPNDYWEYQQHQINVTGCANKIQLGRNAEDLHGIVDSAIPFIIHSHIWEHVLNPLKALEEWVRVITPYGLLFIVVPKRNILEEDRIRPLTTIDELIQRYHEPTRPLTEYKEAIGHVTIFSMALLQQIMIWYNNKHFPFSSLSIYSLLETDDTLGIGHQITWQIHKHIDFLDSTTEMTFLPWKDKALVDN